MKQIFAASFLLFALTACEKTKETDVKCWKCGRETFTDQNGTITKGADSSQLCGLNEQQIRAHEKRNTGYKLLNVTYGDMTCVAKDSL
jgi:ribosomal protein L37E